MSKTEYAELAGPFNISNDAQKRELGICIFALKKAGTKFQVRRLPNSKTMFSLWREKKGMSDFASVQRAQTVTDPTTARVGPRWVGKIRKEKRK